MFLISGFQLCKGLLCRGEIARLERLTDGVQVLLTLAILKYIPISVRATLAKSLERVEILLRVGQGAGSEILTKLLDIGPTLLTVGL
jgi:hypothetical protein